jgi:hypothetical protein
LFDYALFIFLVPFGFWVRFHVAASNNARLIFIYCEAAALFALCIGIGNASLFGASPGAAIFFIRLAASANAAAFITVVLLAISFPYENQAAIFRFLAVGAWAVATYFILFTDRYIVSVGMAAGTIFRANGSLYYLLTYGAFISGLLAAVVLMVRRIFFKSMIYRLQTVIVAAGLAAGYTLAFGVGIVLPELTGATWLWTFLPIGGVIIAAALAYGVTITRLFDVRAAATNAASFILYAATLGAIAGLAYALLRLPIGSGRFALSFLAALAVYLVASRLGDYLQVRFAKLLRSRGSYGERLEDGLTAIDFASGRDAVIATLMGLLRDTIGCASVNLLVENPLGEFINIGSTTGSAEAFQRKTPGIDLLLNNDISIILKTEIISNYEYHDVKDDLLGILEKYDADSLILLREGRAIIGAVLLGAKRTGGDFTSYDYDTLSRVYGKLFVVAYYLKNVAQERLVVTVDREVEFSEQIIQSIQENIDRIAHPAVDIGYMTRSTRKLGGDFIDFIRLTPDRFIFVIGDVAGKGLNASMSMVILKSVIRTFLKETKDFKKLVAKTNAFIKTNLPRGTFFAGVFGLFDFAERSLYYVNCGIPIMYLLSSSYNAPVEIQGDGRVLGFVKDIGPFVSVRKAAFKPDDVLLVTTDGLTDAESIRGQRFGKERIQKSLMENRTLPADRIVRFLSESVEEFMSQEINDDITILAVKFVHN